MVVACDRRRDSNILTEKLLSGEPYFSIVYTSPFASRFNLPVSGGVNLSDYLPAVSVEINDVNGFFVCDLHLYIDSKADIFMPTEGKYFSEKKESEQFYIFNYNEKDQEWNSRILDNNSMRLRFESSENVNPENRFVKTLRYKRVHQEFLPGLSLVTIGTDCDIFENKYYPADIWIQKNSTEGYLVGNDQFGSDKQRDKNYRFEIPEKLIEQIKPYIEVAVKSNQQRNGVTAAH
jgi:hypothetical protein